MTGGWGQDPFAPQRAWERKRDHHHAQCSECVNDYCLGGKDSKLCCPKCPWNTDLHG